MNSLNNSIDAFIPASTKDVPVLMQCIPSLIKHISQLKDIHVSMPSKANIKDTCINGHKIVFHNDLDILNIKNLLQSIKFRPNWIYQQLLKMLQTTTIGDNWFVFDADCVLLKDLQLIDLDGKMSVFRKPNLTDESGFNRFIYKATDGDIGIDTRHRQYSYTEFIVDFQLFNRKFVNELIKKYFSNTSNFIQYVVDNTYYAGSSKDAVFLSEYEMYSQFVKKFHKDSINITDIKQVAFSSPQTKSQNIAGYDNAFILDVLNEYANSEYECIKFQTNCCMSDSVYTKSSNKGIDA